MVEWQLPKLLTRVRFPPGAPTTKKGGFIGLLYSFLSLFPLAMDAIFHLIHPLVCAPIDFLKTLIPVRMIDGGTIRDGEFHERSIGSVVIVFNEPIHEAKAILDFVSSIFFKDNDEFITTNTVNEIVNKGLADDLRSLTKNDVA